MVVLVCVAPAAFGQWATNTWPGYETPRKGLQRATQCYSGMLERALAVGAAVPTAPTWWRIERSEVVGFKSNYVGLLNYRWLPTNAPLSTATVKELNDTYPNSYETNSPIPWITKAWVCTNAYLPTNFFEYTPWRFLSGLGVFTNDASLGYPFGYTNDYTIAGGTNTLPVGRTSWYTTDYGWDGLQRAINLLMYTGGRWQETLGSPFNYARLILEGVSQTTNGALASGLKDEGESFVDGVWANAKTGAETNMAITDGIQDTFAYVYAEGGAKPNANSPRGAIYRARASRQYLWLSVTEAATSTNTAHEVSTYLFATTPLEWTDIGLTFWETPTIVDQEDFDANGSGYVQGWQTNEVFSSSTNFSRLTQIGKTNILDAPVWCDEPDTNRHRYAKGYAAGPMFKLVKWEFLFKDK